MFDDLQKVVEFVIGSPSAWRMPRIVSASIVGALLVLVWKCSEVVGPTDQANRTVFGRVVFDYYDSGTGSWWKRYRERQMNKKRVRELRRHGMSNLPHEQLKYGSPKIYGPGRYFKVPFTVLSYKTLNVTPKIIDFDVFVQWENQYRGAVQPVQLIIRVASLFLWNQSTQNVEGTLTGIAREKLRCVLDEFGADRYIADTEMVKQRFLVLASEIFANYGAEIAEINIAAATPMTEGWIANAILKSNPNNPTTLGAALTVINGG